MDITFAVGLLTFSGVIVGAVLQYIFTRHIEYQRHFRDLRSKAYMDYLKGISDQANLQFKIGSQEQKEVFSSIADAKSRICLYGSKQVISAFSDFEQLGAKIGSTEQVSAFTKMISTMRADTGSTPVSSTTDIQNLLFGTRKF